MSESCQASRRTRGSALLLVSLAVANLSGCAQFRLSSAVTGKQGHQDESSLRVPTRQRVPAAIAAQTTMEPPVYSQVVPARHAQGVPVSSPMTQQTQADSHPGATRGSIQQAQYTTPARAEIRQAVAQTPARPRPRAVKPPVERVEWQPARQTPGQSQQTIVPVGHVSPGQFVQVAAPTLAPPQPNTSRKPAQESNSGRFLSRIAKVARPPAPPAPPTYLPAQQPDPVTPPIAALPAAVAGPEASELLAGPIPLVAPISLDTVFRLVEEQNANVAHAWERVRGACAEKDVAHAQWVPDIYVGTAWYRHEGGIQAFRGPLIRSSTGAMFAGVEVDSQFDVRDYAYKQIDARRKVWQEKGHLSKVTSETVLEAANTYIDLLTAKSGEAIARKQYDELERVLSRARKIASVDKSAKIEVNRLLAAIGAQKQTMLQLREQANGASAKLAYLLGIDPCTEMIPIDSRLAPFELVDASPETCVLVNRALMNGPGVHELESLLALIQESQERSRGLMSWMPTIGVRMAEGGFGAGAGSQSNWDNRFDLGLQARWNVTEFVTAQERRRVAQSKIQQAHLAYQDLRGKLTAGVQEARQSVHSGREQIALSQSQISYSEQAHALSFTRYSSNAKGSSASEVMLALHSVGMAQLNYLKAVGSYNKAQVRLLVLLGPHY